MRTFGKLRSLDVGIITLTVALLLWLSQVRLFLETQSVQPYMGGSSLSKFPELPTLHVLFGLHGDNPTFFEEWEVTLKSLLLNAPTDTALHIHAVTNRAALVEVEKRLQAYLTGSRWRNPLQFTTYNVESYEQEWAKFIQEHLRGLPLNKRVTMGGYYRLLAHRVIQVPDNELVAYMDNDVVLLTNLNRLLPQMNHTTIYQMGQVVKRRCSGFMILNPARMEEFWDYVDKLPSINTSSDQTLFTRVSRFYPEVMGYLDVSWNVHISVDIYRDNPHRILNNQPHISFLHFSGVRNGNHTYWKDTNNFAAYCDSSEECKNSPSNRRKFERTWGLADYYIRVPWQLVRYFGSSNIRPGEEGRLFKYSQWNAD